jgi:hypothetical protein
MTLLTKKSCRQEKKGKGERKREMKSSKVAPKTSLIATL